MAQTDKTTSEFLESFEKMAMAPSDAFSLEDGARISVVGGGPTGSFFSIFALKMARMTGKKLHITIFDPKKFSKDGPGGCNHCGGIISELLVQTLAVEGINLPDSVVRKGISSYRLHTTQGSVSIATPAHEKTIATVYRGGGPKGIIGTDKESFDQFLLDEAIREGALHKPVKVDRIDNSGERPVLFSGDDHLGEADLVVGAAGVNTKTPSLFEDIRFGYRNPSTIRAAIAELSFEEDVIKNHFGNAIHLFLLPQRHLKFAALIPKGNYLTVCILGKKVDAKTVPQFLEMPLVRNVLPPNVEYVISCRCLPWMNVKAPKVPFTNRVVMCGDSGSTRLFKDGLGAAYLMGKAAAKTAVFHGVSVEHFRKEYYPVYKSIILDNHYGTALYSVIGIYRTFTLLTRAMLNVVVKEQKSTRQEKILSSILWDMFTGNERYKSVFWKSAKPRMHIDMWEGLFKGIFLGHAGT